MNRNLLLKLSPGIILVAACTSIDTLNQQIQANIDPEIQGEERAVIAEHMRYLKPEDWKFVTYITNRRAYVNRVQLKGILEVAEPVGNNVYRLSDGTTFPISVEPEDELGYQTTTFASSSGPFRRVRTQPGGGTTAISRFAYASATISPGGFLLGDDSPPSVNTSAGEVVYAYLGTVANSATGLAESDVGLQWSPSNPPGGAWAPFVKRGSTVVTSTIRPTPTRFGWHSETGMVFSVISDGRPRITYTGAIATIPNGSNTSPYNVDFDLPGIRLDGVGNIFKRVTSIAQTTLSNTSGSRVSLRWSNLRLGLTASSGLHVWGQTTRDVAEDCVTAKTQVASTGSGSEEVYINLQ